MIFNKYSKIIKFKKIKKIIFTISYNNDMKYNHNSHYL